MRLRGCASMEEALNKPSGTTGSSKCRGHLKVFDRTEGREAHTDQVGLPGQAARLLAFFGGLITVYYLKERR
jgi:hypothetical protein